MNRESRLSAILKAAKENQGHIESASYGVELALASKEWNHVIRCAERVIAIELINKDLFDEAKKLQEEIDAETLEVIL